MVDQQLFPINLTSADIELIGSLLDDQPFKRVHDLARRMQAQIDANLASAQANQDEANKIILSELVEKEISRRQAAQEPPAPPPSEPAEDAAAQLEG